MDNEGHTNQTSLELKTWTKNDARTKAMKWGGSVLAVGIVMIPIPLIHFVAIPVVLIGMPIISYAVYKMYSNGTDVVGDATCPACQQKLALSISGDRWPVHGVCMNCRAPYTIEKS
jgi:hypothetical protein